MFEPEYYIITFYDKSDAKKTKHETEIEADSKFMAVQIFNTLRYDCEIIDVR